jgi:putative nucleotidyltransferase with HDIG domain
VISLHSSEQYRRNLRGILLSVYAAGLGATSCALVAVLLLSGERLGNTYAIGALVGLALFAERQSIRLTPRGPGGEGIEVSVSSLVFIFAAVVFGPLSAMLVGAAGLLVDLRRPYLRWVIWTGGRAIVAGAAGLAALAVGANPGNAFWVFFAAAALASVVEAGLDLLLGSLTPVIRGTGSFKDLLKAFGPLLVASVPLHAPVIAVLAYAYSEVSPWSAVLFVIPAFAAQRLFLLYRRQRETSAELTAVNIRLERANLSFATALVATLDARDQYTAGHSAAVAIYARDIATRMGLSESECALAHLCGLVHDIGKIGLPLGVLENTGALTLEERRMMETHSEIGERILANVEDYAEIAAVVRHHHERVDGNGYPDGLVNDEIPLLSRIVSVADAYNAMTSHRPYREAMPSRVARLRMAQAVESQFDTSVVAAFEAILAGATEEYRSGTTADFALETREHVVDSLPYPAPLAIAH